jgi:hypothetical protein
MSNISKYIISVSIFIAALPPSCFAQSIKKASDIKWAGIETGISELLLNPGYFRSMNTGQKFIFYNDGTFVLRDDLSYPNSWSYWPSSYFDSDKGEWDLSGTGVYYIKGDTIIANVYSAFHLFGIRIWDMMQKHRFKILCRNVIAFMDTRLIDKEITEPRPRNDTLFFESDYSLPPPRCRIKRFKWLWKNKLDWIKYKKSLKEKEQNRPFTFAPMEQE